MKNAIGTLLLLLSSLIVYSQTNFSSGIFKNYEEFKLGMPSIKGSVLETKYYKGKYKLKLSTDTILVLKMDSIYGLLRDGEKFVRIGTKYVRVPKNDDVLKLVIVYLKHDKQKIGSVRNEYHDFITKGQYNAHVRGYFLDTRTGEIEHLNKQSIYPYMRGHKKVRKILKGVDLKTNEGLVFFLKQYNNIIKRDTLVKTEI